MRILLILTLTSLMFSIAFTQQAHALDKANIAVSAEASVEAMPDYINLSVEIAKTASDQSKAKSQVDAVTAKVLKTLTSMKIADKDYNASQISSRPEYKYENNKRKYVGERVTRQVSVKLRNLNAYSSLVDKLLKLDITRYYQNGVGFDNIDEHRNKALVEAIKRATQKANVIASTIDRDIDKVFQVQESGSTPMPMRGYAEMAMAKSADNSADAPLEIKPQDIQASVSVIFLLK